MLRPIWLGSKTVMKVENVPGKSITQDKLIEDGPLRPREHGILEREDNITRLSQI